VDESALLSQLSSFRVPHQAAYDGLAPVDADQCTLFSQLLTRANFEPFLSYLVGISLVEVCTPASTPEINFSEAMARARIISDARRACALRHPPQAARAIVAQPKKE
jgi:hypothetical protein